MLQSINPAAMTFDPVAETVGPPKLLFHRTSTLAPTSVSPDGRWLALWNLGERQEDIFICRVDGSDLTRLTDDAARDREPRWSPDGSQLAFFSNRSGRYQIWAIGRDGGGLRQVTDSKTDELYFPIYRPGTGRMIVTANSSGRLMYDLDPTRPWADQTPVPLQFHAPAGSTYASVDLSGDGKRLIGSLISSSGAAAGITAYDLASGTLRTVGTELVSFWKAWLPDNHRVLAFTGDARLVLYDVDSGRRRELTLPQGTRFTTDTVVVSPDGHTVYVGVLERESDIWMVERSSR